MAASQLLLSAFNLSYAQTTNPADSHVVVGALAGALSYFQSSHQFANLCPQGLNLSIMLSRLGSLLG